MRNKERSNTHGEVFTPSWLVNQMLDKIDKSSFSTPGKTFVDPACGNGNILVEVIKRKMKNGCTAYQALMTTYGVDIMPDNVADCRKRMVDTAFEVSGEEKSTWRIRLYEKAVAQNIRLGDALKFAPEDIFSLKPSKELKAFREKNKGALSE